MDRTDGWILYFIIIALDIMVFIQSYQIDKLDKAVFGGIELKDKAYIPELVKMQERAERAEANASYLNDRVFILSKGKEGK